MLLNAFKFMAQLLVSAAVLLILDTIFDKQLTVNQKLKECGVLTLLLAVFVSNTVALYYVARSALHLPF